MLDFSYLNLVKCKYKVNDSCIFSMLSSYHGRRVAKTKSTTKAVAKKKSLGSDTSSVNLSTTDSRSSTPVLDQKSGKSKGSAKVEIVDIEVSKRRRRNECVEPVRSV